MPSTILLLLALPLASSLECLHNSTVTNAIYNHGMLIRAYTSNYNLGVLECSEKLTRCVVFKAMDISFFQSLDVAQDQSIFVNLIKRATTEVAGRACMSEADTTKIAGSAG
ncbi:hypothetical protein PMAYCL1PPCAC_08664 [Pristionchus mayeri]|uniref:Uncharacterized protein n=1 Tax=Pristionchus mayeri TaxID=1317129 RepID=A0AAN4ZEF3_9BILA|nr:hypothetical protein PMAYCL1PPCAC_08664 [Pristionchus mayeri]